MKKWLTVLGSLAVIAALVGVGAYGIFTDEGEATNNTFTAGHLDLKINGQENVSMKMKAENMKPGSVYNVGCVTLKNAGSIDGELFVQVDNLVSNENGRVGPEIAFGDPAGAEFDPTGYDNNAGDGELWDQITVKLCMDDGTGSHTGNGQCDWDDTILKGFSSTQDDYSATYSIKTGTDLGAAYPLTSGEKVDFCAAVKFIDDTSNSWWGGQGTLVNNHAMTDDAVMDVIFRLQQAP